MASRGYPVEELDKRPEFDNSLRMYWEMFHELQVSRQYTQAGPQPLAISEIVALVELYEIESADERRFMLRVMQAMDKAWLGWYQSVAASVKPKEQDNA